MATIIQKSSVPENPRSVPQALTAETHPAARGAQGGGCRRLYEEKISGARRDRPQLARLLDQVRKGDVVVVHRLDRLARSTRDLLEIAERLREVGAGLRSLG